MKFRLTVADSGGRGDYTVDTEPDAPVAELLEAIGAGLSVPAFLGPIPLDPADTVGHSGVHDGAIVHLGGPGAAVRDEVSTGLEVRVVGGPSAGLVFRIGPGRHLIGRQKGCAITLNDQECSREHAALELSSGGDLAVDDLGSTNGTRVEGSVVPDGGTALLPGEILEVGRSFLSVVAVEKPDQTLAPDGEGGFVFNRRYRIRQDPKDVSVEFPNEPTAPEKPSFPWIMAIAPLVVAGAMAVIIGNPTFLLLAVMSPVMTVGSTMNERRSRKKRVERDQVTYQKALGEAEATIGLAADVERDQLRYASPDPALALLTAVGPRDRLWERRPTDRDHLNLRIGLASRYSQRVSTKDADHHPELWGVPVTVSLPEVGILGVAAQTEEATGIARWMVLQAATFHSPDDLRIVVLTDTAKEADWKWIEWLPHAQLDPARGLVSIGNSPETAAQRVKELQGMVTSRPQRTARGAPSASTDRTPDVLVVIDGANRMRSVPGMLPLLQSGPSVGVYCICVDSARELLPEECGGVVVFDAEDRSVDVAIHGENPRREVVADQVTAALAEVAARAMAPIHRTGGDDSGSIPTAARLLEVLDLDPPTAEAIVAGWASAVSESGTIGVTASGRLSLDLTVDGPHGLIAGTTGAGKSELLQTLVSGLAVANSPEDLNFVLVDYKGGAAFRDCERLPHTVGLVTDLDGHLTERALRSLRAELKRREHVLAQAGAKDIEDYRDARRRSDQALPALPRLAIVIDEFASLVEEFPDFIKGLVGISQLGRALGVHLILATQRPSGVVSPEIRANSNFAIALRVVNPAESSDIIGSSAAATISPSSPGRAYLRISQEQPVCFQTARIGGRRPGMAQGRLPASAVAADWLRLGLPDPPAPRASSVDDDATDLHVLVESVRDAALQAGIEPQRQPWLEPLPPVLVLDQIPRQSSTDDVPLIAFGIEDRPDMQAQEPATFSLTSGRHLFVAGSPRSGRTSTLRTLAASTALTCTPDDVHLYALDFGNGALANLEQLPHCGAVVPRTQADRAERLIARLSKEVERRHAALATLGVSTATEQRTWSRGTNDPLAPQWPYLLVMLDNWEGFSDIFRDLKDGAIEQQFLQLLRDGGAVGLTVVMSGDRSLLSTSRVASLIEDKLVLRFNDRDDYALAGLSPKSLPADIPAGRAFRALSGDEIQIALLAEDPSGPAQNEALAVIAMTSRDRAGDEAVSSPFRVDALPTQISLADAVVLGPAVRTPFAILAGVGGDELAPSWVDLGQTGSTFVVAGSPESGRSTTLLTIGRTLAAQGTRVVALVPRPSPLATLTSTQADVTVLTGSEARSPDLERFLSLDGPLAVLVDDVEEIGPDDPALTALLAGGVTDRALIVAGPVDEVRDAFRGVLVQVRKSGTGLLLSPKSHLDANMFGVSLPRGSAFNGPPGRCQLFVRGRYVSLLQVPNA